MLNSVTLKSFCEGTFSTKRLIVTIVACGALKVYLYEMQDASKSLTGHIAKITNIVFILPPLGRLSWEKMSQ